MNPFAVTSARKFQPWSFLTWSELLLSELPTGGSTAGELATSSYNWLQVPTNELATNELAISELAKSELPLNELNQDLESGKLYQIVSNLNKALEPLEKSYQIASSRTEWSCVKWLVSRGLPAVRSPVSLSFIRSDLLGQYSERRVCSKIACFHSKRNSYWKLNMPICLHPSRAGDVRGHPRPALGTTARLTCRSSVCHSTACRSVACPSTAYRCVLILHFNLWARSSASNLLHTHNLTGRLFRCSCPCRCLIGTFYLLTPFHLIPFGISPSELAACLPHFAGQFPKILCRSRSSTLFSSAIILYLSNFVSQI